MITLPPSTAAATTATAGMKITSDPAGGHSFSHGSNHVANNNNNNNNNNNKTTKKPESSSGTIQLFGRILQFLLLDVPLLILFILLMTTVVMHRFHDHYFLPLLLLMDWEGQERDYLETTYYHRYCTGEDFTAKSVAELIVTDNFTAQDCANHMLTHGASVYPNLLTNETARVLREWIVQENKLQEGWHVIENENRWSWGIDMTMHPKLQTFWQELAANDKLLSGLEAVVGPNPAIIEFTAITSAYGAADQHLHADVVPPGSATKYARSFLPSYSLFVPLQDTTYEMGATHVCPGSHLCSTGAKKHCNDYNLAMSGPKGEGGTWKMGWGALVNQQTFHKGMGFTQEGAPDRVVLIATFAPRPIHHRGLETRMIGHGGSYSLLWKQWGHTFYDYLHADTRMTQPQATLRSLGVLKGDGINYLSSATMRMANEESGMREDDLEVFLEEGGFSFLPESWQGSFGDESDISAFHSFVLGTLKNTKRHLLKINVGAVIAYLMLAISWDVSTRRQSSIGSGFFKRVVWLAFLCGMVCMLAWMVIRTVDESFWAKGIRAKKAYTLPWVEPEEHRPGTIPHRNDVLLVPHYASTYMASYSRIIDVAHPGNKFWNDVVKDQAHGYASLSPHLQERFCASLTEWITTERRFLEQGSDRIWYNVTDQRQLMTFCHKELAKAVQPLGAALSHEIDSLKNELEFGRFRMTGMQVTQIRGLLEYWEKRILLPLEISSVPKSKGFTEKAQKTTTYLRQITSMVTIGRRKLQRSAEDRSALSTRRSLPPKPTPKPPTRSAWLQDGDRVSVLDGCRQKGRRYPGEIIATFPNLAAFDVEYDSGGVEREVKQNCVIPEN